MKGKYSYLRNNKNIWAELLGLGQSHECSKPCSSLFVVMNLKVTPSGFEEKPQNRAQN